MKEGKLTLEVDLTVLMDPKRSWHSWPTLTNVLDSPSGSILTGHRLPVNNDTESGALYTALTAGGLQALAKQGPVCYRLIVTLTAPPMTASTQTEPHHVTALPPYFQ